MGIGIKTRLLNITDALWDFRLGINTFGYRPGSGSPDGPDWRLHYTPTPYTDIFEMLRLVSLDDNDVFVDLGSGLGRAVFAAAYAGAGKSVGVEVLQDLNELAADNLRHSRLHDRNIEFMCANAASASIAGATVLYIFHSFGDDTLRKVLERLREARAATKPIRIIYRNPVFNSVLRDTPWLRQIGSYTGRSTLLSTTNRYETTIWQEVA